MSKNLACLKKYVKYNFQTYGGIYFKHLKGT
jgi:hypothetical protein